MNRGVKRLVLAAVIVFCVVVLCLPTSIGQDRRSYEVPAQVYGISPGRSDTARAVDAYERLAERYADQSERNMVAITADLDGLARRLDAIDAKLAALDARLARIEQCHIPVSSPAANSAVPKPSQPPIPTSNVPAASAVPAVAPSPSPNPAP